MRHPSHGSKRWWCLDATRTRGRKSTRAAFAALRLRRPVNRSARFPASPCVGMAYASAARRPPRDTRTRHRDTVVGNPSRPLRISRRHFASPDIPRVLQAVPVLSRSAYFHGLPSLIRGKCLQPLHFRIDCSSPAVALDCDSRRRIELSSSGYSVRRSAHHPARSFEKATS